MKASTKVIETLIKYKDANNLDIFYENTDQEAFSYFCRHNELTQIAVNRSGLPGKKFVNSALYANREGRLFGTVKNAEEIAQIIG